ncbi:uncharacterized protein LOC111299995 [Durio zibethinus]|uniref:Uncharacterized protein LOC111299995 n=1 Tax=Durio zibethinus TaxID=66656 RepID=A0A6P5ZG23_DURZI|nr:uncharacterized protein LOC111299995 [Durio zibethinus]
MFKQEIAALHIMASLCFGALMLPTVLCGSDSQTTPINCKPISNYIPPCSEKNQENCVTHSSQANEHQRPCNSWDHCRGSQSVAGSESMSKTQVSLATKQFGLWSARSYSPWTWFCSGCWLGALFFFSVWSVFGMKFMSKINKLQD